MRALSAGRLANKTFLAALIGALLLIVGWTLRVERIDRALPYCQHPDEHTWVSHGLRMVRTGDLNPRRFTKPSLMVYLNALGLRVGMLSADIDRPSALPKECYPYFKQAALIRPLRLIYAGLSLVTVALAALVVRRLAGAWTGPGVANVAALFTMALVLGSPDYLRYSSWYLNVDILGCLTALSVIAFSLFFPRGRRPWTFVLVSAALSGLCIGTKYNLFPIVVAPLLTLVFFHRQKPFLRLPVFFAVALLAFFLTTPYALLDAKTFISDVAGEAQHYASGSGSPQREPGLEMFLAYGGVLVRNFGPVVLVLAGWGLFAAARRDWKSAAIVFSHPLLFWLYMSTQRTFYERNLLVLQLVVPMLAVLGVVSLSEHAFRAAQRWRPQFAKGVGVGLGVVLALSIGLTWPRAASANIFQRHPESRNLASDWLEQNLPAGSTILVARELGMDTRRLKERYHVVNYDAFRARASKLRKKHRAAHALVPLAGRDGKNMPLDKAKVLLRAGKNPIRLREQSRGRNQLVLAGDPQLVVVQL